MNPVLGVTFKIISALLFTGMSAIIKWIGDSVPTGEVVFARSLFAIFPIGLYIIWRVLTHRLPAHSKPKGDGFVNGIAASLHTRRVWGHMWRGVIGCTAMACSFTALTFIPLPDAVAIGYAAPLITVLLAPFMLGERVGIYRLSAVCVGFVGVLLVLSPHLFGSGVSHDGNSLAGAMFALVGAAGVALAMIQVRNLTSSETTTSIAFYFTVSCTLLGLATLPFGWVMPDWHHAIALVLIGLIGGVAQIFLTESYRMAPTSLIAPFDYSTMLWALLLGFVMFAEVPTPVMLAGAGIIVASGLFVIYRERKLGIERGRARKAGGIPNV